MSIPQILADISKARAVISNANTVELHRVHEAIEELLAERDKLKADLSKATSRAEDVRTEGLTIGAGNLIIGNFSLPRVITADELKEGDKYAVIWTHEDGNELVDVARFTPGYNQPGILQGGGGWIMKKDIIAIVLLEDAPKYCGRGPCCQIGGHDGECSPGPGNAPVTAEDIRNSEPGSTWTERNGTDWEWTGTSLRHHSECPCGDCSLRGLGGEWRAEDALQDFGPFTRSTAAPRGDYSKPEPAPELPKVGDKITTAGTLDALPVEAVVLDVNGDAWQKHGEKRWHMAGDKLRATSGQGLCDYFTEGGQVFTILHLPGGGDDA